MRFGICVMANIDEIGFFNHAESLGYDSVWVTDSQMLFSDCYAVLALAARKPGALLRGEVVDYTFNGVPRPIRMLMHESKYMNLEPSIPLYVSGFGPRAME